MPEDQAAPDRRAIPEAIAVKIEDLRQRCLDAIAKDRQRRFANLACSADYHRIAAAAREKRERDQPRPPPQKENDDHD